MLNFIFGRAGSGKSYFLKSIIHKKIKNGGKNIILIVPEQNSFENEKEIIDILGNSDCNKAQVLSFSRLHDFAMRKLMYPTAGAISDVTKNIIMSAAIENVKDRLEIYLPNFKTDIEKIMLDTVQELKSRKITQENLHTIIKSSDKKILNQKIKEISAVLNEYGNLCAGKFIDANDKINLTEYVMHRHDVFGGYTVIFDGFNNFTDQQLSIIELILKQADNVYMAICSDFDPTTDSQANIFAPTHRTIKNIKNLAVKNGIKISEPIHLKTSKRFSNRELKMLEKGLFSTQKEKYEATPQNINIYSALSIYEECENAAKNICKLVIECGYKYRDIAILTRDTDCYHAPLKSVFKRYGIPLFLDSAETVLNKSLINLILSAFDSVISNFRTTDVIRYMKSALLGFSAEEICNLENYALLWSIKSKKWESEFCAHPQGYTDKWSEKDTELLANINTTKNAIITPLINLKNQIKGKTSANKISEAIYNFLIEIHANENLKKFYVNLKNTGNIHTAEKEAKAWDTLMEILSLISQIMGTKIISAKEYLRVLISGLESVDCSSIPQSSDSVIAAKIPGARLSSPKIVFVLGASEGDFPAPVSPSAVFTESETAHIENLGIKICEDKNYLLLKEEFLAYTALCSASERLYISWSGTNYDGEQKNPSEIIKEVKEIFPKIKIDARNTYKISDYVWSDSSAFNTYCAYKNKNQKISETLRTYFEKSNKFSEKFNALKNFGNTNKFNFNSKESARELFGENIKLSASQIENYYKCPFGYLCKYGLNLKPLEPAKFSALEYGNLMHILFEKLFKKYPKNKILEISDKDLKNDIFEIIENYAESVLGEGTTQNPRVKYIIGKSKDSAMLLIKRLIEEFRQSKFVISDCELEISPKGAIKPLRISLKDGFSIEIEGKIDRVDTLQDGGKNYVRIIDYKTGKKTFELGHILGGMDMQMLIYLMTISKNGTGKYKNAIPAGALYFKALKPLFEAKSHEICEEHLKKEMCMSGIVLNDEKIMRAMDSTLEGDFIPVKIKSGKITKGEKSTANLDEFNDIFGYIEMMIKEVGTNIKNGIFGIDPITESGGKNSCDFCKYLQICNYSKEKFKSIKSGESRENIFSQINQKRGEFLDE
ncbi:MAG: exodeoxyribonuclease V subunit gamma [Clostridia bacterium]|nr:exodeoxyribonuclease V subunit gamma [Clostridia bacterium]